MIILIPLWNIVQETSEELSWIEEKQRILDSSRKQVEDENTDLTEKIRLLQKHQALQAEIDRHKPQITEVCSAGNQLVQQGHEARAEVNSNLNSLVKAWEALQSRSNAISKGRLTVIVDKNIIGAPKC